MPDEPSARAWIDSSEAAAVASMPPLSRADLLDAQEARALLPGGVSFADAARVWLSVNAPSGGNEPFAACVARYLDRRRGVLRPGTFASYVQFLKRLERALPRDTAAGAVTQRQVEDAVAFMSPYNRNNALRVWSAFFRWAVAEGSCRADPCARVGKARIPEPPKGVLTPPQAQALLQAAVDKRPDLVPYVAVALFAGVRPAELLRLRSGHVGASYIRLDGSVTKSADARTVPVRANLAAWLKAYPPTSGGPLVPINKKHLHKAIRTLCAETRKAEDAESRIARWPSDCMRHSYATYAYELDKDAAAVAASMGHHGTDIFFRHYRALAVPGDGKKYFAIQPSKPTKPRKKTTK
jgi:integrase